MNVSIKIAGALALGALMIGLTLGRFSLPSKVVTKTETQKETQVSDHSVITRVRSPNGVVTTTIKKDIEATRKSDATSEKITTRDTARWLVSGIVGAEVGGTFSNFTPLYGASVQYRILGPIYIGAQAIKLSPGMFAGASVGIAF